MTRATNDRTWVLAAKGCRISVSRGDFSVRVDSGPASWCFGPSGHDDLLVQRGSERFGLRYTDAGGVEFCDYTDGARRGVRIELRGFQRDGGPLDLVIVLRVLLEDASGDVLFEVCADGRETILRECRWPRALEPGSFESTVVPYMQGMLLPKNWPQPVQMYDELTCSRGLYMPWWGWQQKDSCALLILQTPCDAGCGFAHPAGGPTVAEPRWLHSPGRFTGTHSARLCLIERGGYVELAKRYRRYAIDTGNFVTLREKIARSPKVARLIGSPVVHTSILAHITEKSLYYHKDDPTKNHHLVAFDTRAQQLRELASRGVRRSYVHLDGWGVRGYDNLHPDVLPACPEAGGAEAMKRLADTCRELGFLLAVHDNYRDYYHDAASFDERFSARREDGSYEHLHVWYGGDQSILCAHFAPAHVLKNHDALRKLGISLDGAYLDVFSIVPGDECYHPEHPITRQESLARRAECFNLIRAMEGVASSEEPCDWAVPYLDLVHHGPYALSPDPGKDPAFGIPVPLFNLVYHDAILLPWTMSDAGGWGIPDNDAGYLHALLNAGLPYLDVAGGEEELKRVRNVCALARRVGLEEMMTHEMLDPGRRRQRTTYSGGTSVTVDFDRSSFEISPRITQAELGTALGADS